MEIQISRIFQTANHWNALILLDEADVYLERRSTQDVARNKLVSVFLRKLEYCEGILFLTTNRVSDFDEAILSRIHLMLKYEGLSTGARRQIWEYFLHRTRTSQGAAVIARKDIERLATTAFNGRQVGLLCNTSGHLIPLTSCLLDQKCRCHSSRFSYQEEYPYGLFPCHTGCQGERELYPRIQRYQHRRESIPLIS